MTVVGRSFVHRALEWFGLRESPADDDALAVYLAASGGLMLLAGLGPKETGAVGTWWSLFGVALMAVLVGKAKRPERDWRVKALAGVAAAAFSPLGIALVLGLAPGGTALAALVVVPGLIAAAIAAGPRLQVALRGASRRRSST